VNKGFFKRFAPLKKNIFFCRIFTIAHSLGQEPPISFDNNDRQRNTRAHGFVGQGTAGLLKAYLPTLEKKQKPDSRDRRNETGRKRGHSSDAMFKHEKPY